MAGLSTALLPKAALDLVKRSRPLYALARRARFALGTWRGPRAVPGIPGRTHPNDFMLPSTDPVHVATYLRGAQEWMAILGGALTDAGRGWGDVGQALEVGCGYGRIVRELVARLPPDRIAVCDVIPEAAAFTAAEFGVRRIPPIEAGGTPPASFDLIYLLSVYTHLDRPGVALSLRRAAEALAPGGVLVFTTHGPASAATTERYGQYWLDPAKVRAGLAARGFYYERYLYYAEESGLTWFTRPALEALVAEAAPGLAQVSCRPAQVDGHQDVYAYRKA